MGGAKPFVRLGGRPLVEYVIDAAREVTDDVMISAKDEAPYAELGMPVVCDVLDVQSPLAGVHAVLSHVGAGRVLCVAADMPLVRPSVLRLLIDFAPEADIVVPKIDGRYEPLLAVYGARCAAPIERRLARGERQAFCFYEDDGLVLRTVSEEALRAVDPDLYSLLNVNTPDDLLAVERIRSSEN